jgi:flagellar hook-associated protein 1 FlgK
MTSLTAASQIAYTGLSAAQYKINLTSANISNADVSGYTTKTATQVSTVSSNGGSGTQINATTSSVDKYMFASLVSADSDLAASKTTQSYANQLQSLLGSTTGTTDGGTSITSTISSLNTAVSNLASSPDSDTNKAGVIDAAKSAADQIRSISTSIQSQRTDADSEISDDVKSINSSLTTIDGLNKSIVQAKAQGQSTADLEDQRNTALRSIASNMDVNYSTTSSGAMYISTNSGTALLDSSVHSISYTPASTVSPSTTFGGITVDGNDITHQITSGSISSLVTMRDKTLVNAQSAVDTLASSLTTNLNAVTADGSAVPAPTTLTGTTSISASDAFSGTGSVSIALVNSSGTLASSSNLDLSSYSTVGDLVNGLNSISGISASIDTQGHLEISSTTSGEGVAVGKLDSSIGSTNQTFSSYFGLNSLFTGTGASDISVSSALTSDPSKLATGTLATGSNLTDGNTVLTSGDATVANGLQSAMSASYSYAASGGLGAQTSTISNYASTLVANIASTASDASTKQTAEAATQSSLQSSVTSASGVNIDEETAKLTDYQKDYNASAQVLSTVDTLYQTILDVAKQAATQT